MMRQRQRPYWCAHRRADMEQLATPHRAELERRVAEPSAGLGGNWLRRANEIDEAPSGLARIRRARRATQPDSMPENGSLEAIGRVEKIVKEEMGERWRGSILARYLPASGLI